MSIKINSRFFSLLVLCPFAFCFATAARAQTVPFKITSMKALLFFEDNGTFSTDAAEDDHGPPYVPPKFWNTPLQYENRSTSVFVVIEVTGDPGRTPERRLEFLARYIPWTRESRPIVVRRIVPIRIPINAGKADKKDKYFAGFWLYETGCNTVKLTARVIGARETAVVKKVIKFDCGE